MGAQRQLSIEELSNLLNKILMQKDALQQRLVSPRNTFSPDYLTFLIYGFPILNVISVILLIVLHYLLWSPKFFHMYGYMSLYSILDLVQSSTEIIVISVVHFLGKDYIEYTWCSTYFAMSTGLPFALYSWAQWIKVGQALQRVLMVYLPVTFRKYINLRNFVIGAFVILSIGATLPVLQIWGRNLESTTMADASAKKVILVCTVGDQDETHKLLHEISAFCGMAFADGIPIVLMGIFSSMMLRKIYLQTKFRKQFQKSESNSTDRMLIVVAITTIFSVICTLPRIIDTLTLKLEVVKLIPFMEASAIIGKSLQCISVPFTFLLFGSLSPKFRNTCNKICKCFNSRGK